MRTHIISTGIIAFVIASSVAQAAPAPATPRIDRVVTIEKPEHPDLAMLRKQLAKHPHLPTTDLWNAVGRCETGLGVNGSDTWARGAQWDTPDTGGALGIAQSAWEGYGGLAYGKHAGKASKYAQIVVANRIGFLGFQTRKVFMTWQDKAHNRPYYRPAAGFGQGWGGTCFKNWVKKHGLKKGFKP